MTNPGRFAPLHEIALALLDRLEEQFEVERAEGYGLDPVLEPQQELARRSVKLVPRGVDGAPIAVVFSTFPGLRIRFGRWYTHAFPACGCDTCAETLDGQTRLLQGMIEDLTAGRFREALQIPPAGAAKLESEFWSVNGRAANQSMLDRGEALKLLSPENRLEYNWVAWRSREPR